MCKSISVLSFDQAEQLSNLCSQVYKMTSKAYIIVVTTTTCMNMEIMMSKQNLMGYSLNIHDVKFDKQGLNCALMILCHFVDK